MVCAVCGSLERLIVTDLEYAIANTLDGASGEQRQILQCHLIWTINDSKWEVFNENAPCII